MNSVEALKQQIKNLKKAIERDEEELKKIKGYPATVRLRWIYCGKNCRTCPHGPYYYGYKKHNKKLKTIYIGKDAKLAQESQAAQQLINQIKHKRVILRRLEERLKKLQRSKAA